MIQRTQEYIAWLLDRQGPTTGGDSPGTRPLIPTHTLFCVDLHLMVLSADAGLQHIAYVSEHRLDGGGFGAFEFTFGGSGLGVEVPRGNGACTGAWGVYTYSWDFSSPITRNNDGAYQPNLKGRMRECALMYGQHTDSHGQMHEP